ncbi:hypothetical protein ACFXAF_12405 [Kitasatospora sp. NPDC059463]|uniref:hypothetical protein n=1 Tax=unclassified Kitasatospora TaxID=2633591 RepID=UPI0036BE55FB
MPDPRPTPASPVSELGAMAIQMHELFTEYQAAGFTRPEALELVKALLVAQVRRAQ